MNEQTDAAAPVTEEELEAALRETGYRYTDPVNDPRFRRITAHDPERVVDAFPENWGAEPTARDQAAIEAGNA